MTRALWLVLGFFWLLAASPAAAEEWAPCRTEGYLSHFDARLTAQSCDVVATVTIPYRSHAITLRAIKRSVSPMSDDPGFADTMRAVANQIGAAMNRMGPGLRLGDVTVLYTNMLSASGTEGREEFLRGDIQAWASSLTGTTDYSRPGATRECPITYYKGVGRSRENWLHFVLAHEVFHCIQYNSWPTMPRDKWLIEGSAEYFAYLAQPSGDGDGDRNIALFDSRIPGTPFSRIDYDAVVFFLWFGGINGAEGVHAFVRDARSLENAINADRWFKFAEDYEDQQIKFPDGRPIGSRPAAGRSLTIAGAMDFTKPSAPFTINTYTYAFARGKIFDLTYSEMPEDGREAWRKLDGAAWAEPPASVTTCDGEKRYRVLWTTTRSSSAGRTRINARPASAADCTCPAGTWQETAESTRHFEEQSILGDSTKHFIGGTRTLTLNPDHTGSFTYNSVEIRVGNPGDELWLHQVQTGGTHFTWKLVNGMLLTVYTPGNNLVTLHNENHARDRVFTETRQAGAQSIGHYYHCDEAGLHLTQRTDFAGPLAAYRSRLSVNMDFVRTGGP